MNLPRTLGELRKSAFSATRLGTRKVKDELRDNLIAKLCSRETIFPGIIGYDDTVVPQLVNAILSRHNFILLGLRGQAKSRILRALTGLLDAQMPYLAGCEIHDNPYDPICKRCRTLIAEQGDNAPIAYLTPDDRYVEKLATPDVTIADLIGDVDPIKAARGGHDLSSELTVHYGLLPRANRGLFAINELPDLCRSKATPCVFRWMLPWFSAPTPKTTRRAARSLPRSRIALARRFAPTIQARWKRASALPSRKPGRAVTAWSCMCPSM
jgi:magnesium chelatase subunit I